MPPWYQELHHDVAPLGVGDQRAVVGDAVLGVALRSRQLVVRARHQLAADDVVDRVGTQRIAHGRVADGGAAAAELVGEDDLGRAVVERRGVPEREVRVGDRCGDPRLQRVAELVVPAQTPVRVGLRRRLGHGRRAAVREQHRRGDDRGVRRRPVGHRHDADLVVRWSAVLLRRGRAVGGDVHEHPANRRVRHEGVGVRPAVGFDVGQQGGLGLVRDARSGCPPSTRRRGRSWPVRSARARHMPR